MTGSSSAINKCQCNAHRQGVVTRLDQLRRCTVQVVSRNTYTKTELNTKLITLHVLKLMCRFIQLSCTSAKPFYRCVSNQIEDNTNFIGLPYFTLGVVSRVNVLGFLTMNNVCSVIETFCNDNCM